MKKIRLFGFSIILIICLCICGCVGDKYKKNAELKLYQLDFSDCNDGGLHVAEYQPWAEKGTDIIDLNAEKSKIISFNGTDFKGEYQHTGYNYFYNNQKVNSYITENGLYKVDYETGTVVYFLKTNKENEQIKEKLTIQEKQEKAIEFIKQYIDPSDYNLEITEELGGFSFTRELKGVLLAEQIYVSFKDDGSMRNFYQYNIDRYSNEFLKSNEANAEKLLSESTKEKVKEKVKNLHQKKHEITENTPIFFVKTEEGNLGLVYSVEITFEPEPTNEKGVYDVTYCRMSILVTI